MNEQRQDRYCVAFRKFEPDLPAIEWIEVTVLAINRRDAINRARRAMSSVPGLIYGGTN
jgi:hypothetical protein